MSASFNRSPKLAVNDYGRAHPEAPERDRRQPLGEIRVHEHISSAAYG